MHELSIANQLVTVAQEEAQKLGAHRVNVVTLQLGELSGVVREALEFAWEFVTEATMLEGAKLVIEPIDVLVHCSACGRDSSPPDPRRLRCVHCDEPTPELLRGRELTIRSIDYDATPVDAQAS